MMSQNPMVSVVMITYGHENYIRQAIEGVLMQNCDFEVELIVANDCSPDKTDLIIKDIIQNHPRGNWIKYHHHEKNLGMKCNFIFALEEVKGKYVALCDGDDYWIDSLKLQKQVDFLEAKPSYSLVCSGFKSVNTLTLDENVVLKDVQNCSDNTADGFDINIERFLNQWVTKTLTVLFRKTCFNSVELSGYKYSRDVHLMYHLLKSGNGYYMKEVFGVYHIHEGGVFSHSSTTSKLKMGYLIYKEIYENSKDKYVRKKYVNKIYNMINSKIYLNDNSFSKHKMILDTFLLIKNKKDFKRAIRMLNNNYIGLNNILKKRKI